MFQQGKAVVVAFTLFYMQSRMFGKDMISPFCGNAEDAVGKLDIPGRCLDLNDIG